jgi:hypothetical protein
LAVLDSDEPEGTLISVTVAIDGIGELTNEFRQ